MDKVKRVKVWIRINYVDEFVFNDIYEASTFMTSYAKGANKGCKFEVAISFEEVEDPVYSEPVPTKGVDFDN